MAIDLRKEATALRALAAEISELSYARRINVLSIAQLQNKSIAPIKKFMESENLSEEKGSIQSRSIKIKNTLDRKIESLLTYLQKLSVVEEKLQQKEFILAKIVAIAKKKQEKSEFWDLLDKAFQDRYWNLYLNPEFLMILDTGDLYEIRHEALRLEEGLKKYRLPENEAFCKDVSFSSIPEIEEEIRGCKKLIKYACSISTNI